MIDLLAITRRLADACDDLRFGVPVASVYNPLRYAWEPHRRYLEQCAMHSPSVVLVGMNPGPNGMLQTGVPFGDVRIVREWMGIEAAVEQPEALHPKRPVQGFDCRRREVSGSRVWGWAQSRFGSAERFFDGFFVANYCPLAFFDADGKNRTPDKLRGAEQRALFDVCDRALGEYLDCIRPRAVIGIGKLAEQRAAAVAAARGIAVVGVTHPSPANPRANAGWDPLMDAAAREAGVAVEPLAAAADRP